MKRYFNRKGNRLIRTVTLILLIVLAVVDAMFLTFVHSLGILQQSGYVIIIAVFVLIMALFAILLLNTKRASAKRLRSLLALVLTDAVLIIAIVCITLGKNKIFGIFDSRKIQTVANMNVYVLKSGEINDLEDLAALNVGVQTKFDSEQQAFAVKALNKEIKGEDIRVKNCDSIYDAIDRLYNGSLEAIIINEDYLNTICNRDGYQDFSERVNLLITIPHAVEINMDTSDVNITKEPFVVAITASDEWDYTEINQTKGSRSDVNMVAAVNPIAKKIVLVSFPRDSYLRFATENGQIVYDKLTHISILGYDVWKRALAETLDLDINYYVRVNFSSLIDIVDSIGGIDVNNDAAFRTEYVEIYDPATKKVKQEQYEFERGPIHLDGVHALAYCRERHDLSNGDLGRNAHQLAVINACIDKVCSLEIITKIGSVLDALKGKFSTDISAEEILALAKEQLNEMANWTIEMYAIDGTSSVDECFMLGYEASTVALNLESVQKAQRMLRSVIQ